MIAQEMFDDISKYNGIITKEIGLFLYKKLIRYRKINIPQGYTEVHHIIPKVFCKNKKWKNSETNLIKLKPSEHFLAHFLLFVIHPTYQTMLPYITMWGSKWNTEKDIIKIWAYSKEFEIEREKALKFLKNKSIEHQEKITRSKQNLQFIFNPNTKRIKYIKKDRRVPEGWLTKYPDNWEHYNKGKNNGMYGKGYLLKGKTLSDETKQKISEASKRNNGPPNKGKKMYKNGNIIKYFSINEIIPEGFKKASTPGKKLI